MNSPGNTRDIQRYIALDIHKEYVMVGAMNTTQEWVIRPRRVEMIRFRTWATNNLRVGDAVVIETTTNVWDVYDIVSPLVTRTVVAHAGAVRQIAEARVKTDGEDIKRLLRLLIADIVPEVWVPPAHVRELRGMISYRNRLVKTGAMIRNRLHSLLHRHNLPLSEGGLTDQDWWEAQSHRATTPPGTDGRTHPHPSREQPNCPHRRTQPANSGLDELPSRQCCQANLQSNGSPTFLETLQVG